MFEIAAALRRVTPHAGANPLKVYPGFLHGMPSTHADVINPDLLAFVKS